MPYFTHLECSGCGGKFQADQVQTYCPDCQAPLLARYDLAAARDHLSRESQWKRPSGMWRWSELLPVFQPQNIVTLGEGDTPLLLAPRLGNRLGLTNLYIKDEGCNPTGSFKARGLAVAISKCKELGIEKVIIPTAGNAGGAMAAYAARAGLEACIFMPKDSQFANIEESRIAGATVILVDGLISEAAGMAGVKARDEGWFDLSTFKEPYRVEGKKVMGYELAESFDWELPDVIIYPTGGGTGLVAMWKAFDELEALGWLNSSKRPRMVVVQAEGCAPVVDAFQKGKRFCDFWTDAHTLASGLRVPKSFGDQLILTCLKQSQGTAVAVSDDEILQAVTEVGESEGVFTAPEGGATYAGLKRLFQSGWVQPDERVILFNTGTGLKYLK